MRIQVELKGISETRKVVLRYQNVGKVATTEMRVHCHIDGNEMEVTDIEMSYSVLNRKISMQTFKTLYNDMYDADAFEVHNNHLQNLAEDTAIKDFDNNKF
tara:strand:+ start:728 stop:1030 length:303 start_codon:yes stop_codon:yes gene_type:complete